MYVRLAFAVAAHLEPEILVVDEVLSVGDAGFQKRCFRKMEEIRNGGSTVMVVSHNLGAIQTLCTYAIQLERGELVGQGQTAAQIAKYLARLGAAAQVPLDERTDRDGDGAIRVSRLYCQDSLGQPVEQAVCGEELRVVVGCTASDVTARIETVALSCWSADGSRLFHVDTAQRGTDMAHNVRSREFVCRIPRLPLAPGLYQWNVLVIAAGRIQDHVYSAAAMEVLPGDFYRTGQTAQSAGCAILVEHDWI
jgi:lipopolysaccharide transport system ATP-binding protein